MPGVRAGGLAAASAAVFSLVVACGSGAPGVGPRDSNSTERRPDQPLRLGSVVATDVSCEYTGIASTVPGEIVIDIENRTSAYLMNVFLREIVGGHTFAEFVVWTDQQNANVAAGLLPGPPDWVVTPTEEFWIPPGGRERMEGPVKAGMYAIECAILDPRIPPLRPQGRGRLVRGFASGPIHVSP